MHCFSSNPGYSLASLTSDEVMGSLIESKDREGCDILAGGEIDVTSNTNIQIYVTSDTNRSS